MEGSTENHSDRAFFSMIENELHSTFEGHLQQCSFHCPDLDLINIEFDRQILNPSWNLYM